VEPPSETATTVFLSEILTPAEAQAPDQITTIPFLSTPDPKQNGRVVVSHGERSVRISTQNAEAIRIIAKHPLGILQDELNTIVLGPQWAESLQDINPTHL